MADNVHIDFEAAVATPQAQPDDDDGELGHGGSSKLLLALVAYADSNFSPGRFKERLGDVEYVLGRSQRGR
jgi:hypothetical protein